MDSADQPELAMTFEIAGLRAAASLGWFAHDDFAIALGKSQSKWARIRHAQSRFRQMELGGP